MLRTEQNAIFSATLPSRSLGVATVLVAGVSVTGARETADSSVVGVAAESSLHDHATIAELVSA